MRILRAEITGFGKYRNQTIDFTSGNQLFYGANEAGKSTLYQFIMAMLFGFPLKRGRKRDFEPLDGTSYGGRLVITLPVQGEVTIERFKQVNRGKAKVYLRQQTGDDTLLNQLIAPLNRELFEEVFTFQQEQLAQIERLQEKPLHDALISLGITGSKKLLEKQQTYNENEQKIFKVRGQRQALNKALKEREKIAQQVSQQETKEAAITDLLAGKQKDELLQQELTEKLKQAQQEYLVLKEKENSFPQYEEWQVLQKKYPNDELGAQPEKLQEFYNQYNQLNTRLAEGKQALVALNESYGLTDRYRFYLEHEIEIKNLLQDQVTAVRLTDDFQAHLREQQQLIEAVTVLEDTYQFNVGEDPQKKVRVVKNLVQDYHSITSDITQAQQEVRWQKEQQPVLSTTPSFFQQQTGAVLPTLIASFVAVIFVIGGILSTNVRFVLWAIALIAVGVALYNYQKKTTKKHSVKTKDKQQESHKMTFVDQLMKKQEQIWHHLQTQLPLLKDPEDLPVALVQLQNAAEDYLVKNNALMAVDQRLDQLDQAYGAFLQRFSFLDKWVPQEGQDILQRLLLVQNFADEMQEVKLQQEQPTAALLIRQNQQLQQQLDQLVAENQNLLSSVGITQPTEIPLWIAQMHQKAGDLARKQELAARLKNLFPKKITATQLAMKRATVQKKLEELQLADRQVNRSIQSAQLKIEQMQSDGTLDELRQSLTQADSKVYELALQWGKNKLLAALLGDLATELSDKQLPQLLQKSSEYLKILTKDNYTALDFIEGELVVKTKNQNWQIYELSTGTKDQVIMAVRFGYLSLQERILCPLIIDDGWLHYDSIRKEQLAVLLKEFSQDYQVICLSSDVEMVSYYEKLQQKIVVLN
ncbi:hypothetical protein EsVE80_02960 [Enterococcus saigonensis]|uniref:YhaN AAA domain-containing protein n=1 Tax=Enterococcus saigonensis TaxID=1805431 RepID=A0A679I8W7_9ENTE|nr:AAA family ATPase [Enterococcus saigonensis]BCA84773.1 hypothetical protein EsVE80_02960 [Enterococcus saigonensis]